jgi:uncharacterized protein (TIGR00251 family)
MSPAASVLEKQVIPILEASSGISFAIKVQPRARKNAVIGELGDALKVSLTTPPVEGRANQACIEFFANLLKVPRSSVTIASGQKSRRKVIRVAGLSAEEVRQRIRI